MAHNIHFNNVTGKHSFVTKKELPWHNLGQVVESMTSKEAIVLGGLDFTVEKRPLWVDTSKELSFEDAKINPKIVRSFNENKPIYTIQNVLKDKFATVRTDNDCPLGLVGSRYEVIQNSEAFEFFDSIVGEDYADYETVGALGNGETVFITAKLKAEMVVNKDLIENYLLLSMAHDGSASINVMFTPIRVVCNNTLSLALQGKNKVTIRHTKNAREKLEHSKKVLGLVDRQLNAYQKIFDSMVKIPVKDEEAELIMAHSLGLKADEKGRLSTRAMNILENAKKYYEEGIGQKEIVDTGWGVYNGITGYLQNMKEYRDADMMFTNTLLKDKARDIAYESLLDLQSVL